MPQPIANQWKNAKPFLFSITKKLKYSSCVHCSQIHTCELIFHTHKKDHINVFCFITQINLIKKYWDNLYCRFLPLHWSACSSSSISQQPGLGLSWKHQVTLKPFSGHCSSFQTQLLTQYNNTVTAKDQIRNYKWNIHLSVNAENKSWSFRLPN